MPDFKRGRAAIDQSAARKQSGGGGGREPVVPQLFWSGDGTEKWLKFLTPVSEVPTINRYHEWIPVTYKTEDGQSYERNNEHFISRKDECIGEDYDDLEDRLGMNPRQRCLGVAVELDPVWENKSDKKPSRFVVQVNERNEIAYPAIGLVVQSPQNFWGYLSAYEATEQPIENVVFRVVRQGKGPDTTYNFFPTEGKEVDFSALIDNIPNVRFIASELDEDDKSPETIAQVLLDKRLDQLADPERYRKLVTPIQQINNPFTGGGSSSGNSDTSNQHHKVLEDLKQDVANK